MKHIDSVAKCLAVLAIAVGSCLITGYLRLADNLFLAFSFGGVLLLHVWTRPRLWECLITVLCGISLAELYKLVGHPFGDFFGNTVIIAGAFLGHASLLVLLARALWSEEGRQRQTVLRALLPGSALIVYMVVTSLGLELAHTAYHRTYDVFLYAFDDSLGFQASFLLGRLFASSRPLWCLGFVVYESLPLAVAFLYAAQSDSEARPAVNILTLFMAVGLAGFAFYQIYPACGPIYAFAKDFPWRAPAVSELSVQTVQLAAPPNAMPSLHATWALLLWWNSRRLRRWVQAVTGCFLLITLLTTLGSGEHYLVDLVVAAPFALAMQAACTSAIPLRVTPRLRALVAGGVVTAVWITWLRLGAPYFAASSVLAWVSVAGTLLASALLAERLHRAAVPVAAPQPPTPVLEPAVAKARAATASD